MSSKPTTPITAREVVDASPIPLFDGPSKQAAALMLESRGLSIEQGPMGFRIRKGRRGWTAKSWEPTLREAIDAYRQEGPALVVLQNRFHLKVASALAGTQDEKPYRELVACYSDAVDMLKKLELGTIERAVQVAGIGTPARTELLNKVIQFPNRGNP